MLTTDQETKVNDPNDAGRGRSLRRLTPRDCEAGQATLEEFAILPVGLDEAGAPNPGHIAARLRNLHTELQAAIEAGDLGAICNAADRLGRLQGVLQY